MSIDDIVGNWIKEAEKSGELKKLKGHGKPMPDDADYWRTPAAYRLAHKILKNSGFTPGEVKLVDEIATLKEKLRTSNDEEECAALRKEISEKQLRVQLFLEQSRK